MFRILALDFDGVISNSAPEAFVVAMRTWIAARPDSRIRCACDERAEGEAPSLAAVRTDPLFEPFVRCMPLGNRAEDYAVVIASIEAGVALPDQGAYDAYRERLDPDWLHEYHALFYRVRAKLAEADAEGWHRLMAPYGDFIDVLRRRAGEVTLCIATAKDRGSVRRLLDAYRIRELFRDDLVLDKDTGVTKRAHLEHLQKVLDRPFDEMLFIDDKVSHLDAVAGLGVRCGLAEWGFNGEREVRLARSAGHLVCTLADVERQIFG